MQIAFLFLLIIAVCRGSAFLFIKIGVETLPVFSLVLLRVSLASAILILFVLFKKYPLPKSRNQWLLLILIGVVGNIVPFSLVSYAELTLDSGIAAVLIGLVPLFVFILGHFFTEDEKLNINKSIGVVLGFSGVVLLSNPPLSIDLLRYLVAVLAGAGAALAYAASTIIAKKLGDIEPSVTAAAVLFFATITLLPVVLVVDFPLPSGISSASILSGVALAVFSTAIPFVLMYRLIASEGASFFTLHNYLIPIVGVILGVIILDEHIRLNELLGTAIILVSITLCTGNIRIFGGKRARI